MPTLRELQDAFARGVTHADFAAIAALVLDGEVPAVNRLGIYRNTYLVTLNKALCATYPAVGKLVGQEFLEGAVAAFVEENPPRTGYLNDYGGEFGDFLAGFAPAASLPYLPDVARVEWAISAAANAPDAPVLDMLALASLGADEQARLRLTPHPSLRMVRASHDADLIRRAVLESDDAALAALRPRDEPFWLLVHRAEDGVISRRLGDAEHSCTAALCAGVPLASVMADANPDEIAVLLADHFVNGRFTGFEIADEPAPV